MKRNQILVQTEFMTLKENYSYSIEEKLFHLFDQSLPFLHDCLAIIITDVPCEDFYLYPDIRSMFGNIGKLGDKFEEYKLHATVLWLTVSHFINSFSF